ncbi:MAG: flagellar motor switch protein FliN [Planctomycetota bacterium]
MTEEQPTDGQAPESQPEPQDDVREQGGATDENEGAEAQAADGDVDPSEAEDALEAARRALAAATAEVGADAEGQPQTDAGGAGAQADGDAQPFTPPVFEDSGEGPSSVEIEMLSDVDLDVKIELGRTRMLVEDVLKLGEGAVVELDKLAGDPVDVYVNGRHVARGEVLVLNDQFCIRISDVLDGAADPSKPAISAAAAAEAEERASKEAAAAAEAIEEGGEAE